MKADNSKWIPTEWSHAVQKLGCWRDVVQSPGCWHFSVQAESDAPAPRPVANEPGRTVEGQ